MREKLSGYNPHQNLITEMVSNHNDAKTALELIRNLAEQLRGSPDLQVEDKELDPELLDRFCSLCRQFDTWSRSHGFEAEGNRDICEALLAAAKDVEELKSKPHHTAIMAISRLRLSPVIQKADGECKLYRMKTKWQAAAPSKKLGEQINEEACRYYDAIVEAIAALKAHAASCALSLLRNELKPLLEKYRERKRAGAALDFEDLLVSTRRMLKEYPEIAKALGERFAYILVDEFQDTDPVQAEIFLHLSFDKDAEGFWVPRPGAIFLVGDPKQSIYRFRGADVRTYLEMKSLLKRNDPESILEISTNFRSSQGILSYVNSVFSGPLSEPTQPGFTALSPFRNDVVSYPAVSTIHVEDYATVGETRDIEARRIAEICRKLIGSEIVYDKETKRLRKCKPSDIALLAPTGTDLWRYELALEEEGISVATQAGKGMFQRQEVQDLIAITRVLADPRDQLALGALLRGPLVGLTENDLLDASHDLPKNEDGSLNFIRVGLPLEYFKNDVLRDIMAKLNSLRERAATMTPHDVLCAAVDELNVRATVRARHIKSPNRALANIDRYLEMSRAYAIRGLRAFSDDMRAIWEEGERLVEARPDGEDKSVSLITMHSAKGLEWPVVFLINGMTEIPKQASMIVDVSSRQITMPFFGTKPANYESAREIEAMEARSERVRLLYVAATRARDMLVIPVYAKQKDSQWASVVDLRLDTMPLLNVPEREKKELRARDVDNQTQDKATFEEQARTIKKLKRPVYIHTPSRHEPVELVRKTVSLDDLLIAEPLYDPTEFVRGSAERGTILHKLIEELLTGELEEELDAITRRSEVLTDQLEAITGKILNGMDHEALAKEVMQTLSLPQIKMLKDCLVPEITTMRSYDFGSHKVVENGIMDAVVFDDCGQIDVIIDWKSDRFPSEEAVNNYVKQVRKYMTINGAKRGYVVFTATGNVVELSAI